jgi:hypothetical protein
MQRHYRTEFRVGLGGGLMPSHGVLLFFTRFSIDIDFGYIFDAQNEPLVCGDKGRALGCFGKSKLGRI